MVVVGSLCFLVSLCVLAALRETKSFPTGQRVVGLFMLGKPIFTRLRKESCVNRNGASLRLPATIAPDYRVAVLGILLHCHPRSIHRFTLSSFAS